MKSKFNPWPCGIVAFFILLLCGITTVVVIAATHQESMVTENYYEQELKYQDRMESVARAEKAGARIELRAGGHQLLVELPAAQVSAGITGNIEFYRPSAASLDRQLALAPAATGVQTVDASQFAAGLWHVRVQWRAAGQDYFLEQKITL